MILILAIAAVGIIILTVVYLRDSQLQLWPRGRPSNTPSRHIHDMREAREAAEAHTPIK